VRFDHLDAVAEWIVDMAQAASLERLIGRDLLTGLHCLA
jgi:hypothetical protein